MKKKIKSPKRLKTSEEKDEAPRWHFATVTEWKYNISSDEEGEPAKKIEKGSGLNSDSKM